VLERTFRQVEEFICGHYPLQITEIEIHYT